MGGLVVSAVMWLAFWISVIGGLWVIVAVLVDAANSTAIELPRFNRTRGWWKARRVRRLHRRSGRA